MVEIKQIKYYRMPKLLTTEVWLLWNYLPTQSPICPKQMELTAIRSVSEASPTLLRPASCTFLAAMVSGTAAEVTFGNDEPMGAAESFKRTSAVRS